jgi:gluconolactonase
LVIAGGLLWSAPAWCQDQRAAAPPAQEMTTPDIPGVVAGGTKVRLLRQWDESRGGEGPIAAPDGSLLFAEQEANRIIRLGTDGAFTVYLEDTNRTTGLAFDAQGRLIGTGAKPPQVLVLAPVRSVLVDRFDGHPFLRPKHVAVDRSGGIYFTDLIPVSAQDRGATKPPPTDGASSGIKPAVYYITPDRQIVKATEDVPEPNGIILSPDEKTLFVTNLPGAFVMAFDVESGGRVRRARNFARLAAGEASRADGLAVDAMGRLYVAAVGGVQIFSPEGQLLGTIPFRRKPGNLAFAGPDKKTLYVISRGVLYAIAMQAQGVQGRAK